MVSITLDWETKYTKIGGIIRSTVAAITLPERAIPLAAIWFMATGRVFRFSLKMVPLGYMAHASRKANKDKVNQAGLTRGITRVQKMR